jgi:protoporphyrinogen oxidase
MPDFASTLEGAPISLADRERPHPVVILGAGVSGLVAADILASAGHEVIVLEPYDRLGGNQRSRTIGEHTFDIGSFVFSAGSAFFRRFPAAEAVCVPARIRVNRITPQGRISEYPYSIADDLLRRGPVEIARTFLSLCHGRLTSSKPESAASFARYHLGDRLFVQSGLRAYIQRLCGVPADEVEYRFAEKRMAWITRELSFSALAARLRPRPKTAIVQPANLVRPREGFEVLFAQVAAHLAERGVTIHRNCAIENIEAVARGFQVATSQGVVSASRVISSIPLKITAQAVGIAADEGLESLPLLTLYVACEGDPGFEAEVLYNFSDEGSWKRLTVHSRIYGKVDGRHYFSVEVPLAKGPSEARAEFTAFLAFMRRRGLLRESAELLGHDVTGYAYPIYAQGSMDASEALMDRIEATGVEMLGRQGRFDYIPTAARATQLAVERMDRDQHAALKGSQP